jgi:ribosomal protein L11 methyltransferase
MQWSTVVVIVGSDEVDVVSGLLWNAGVAGIEECGLENGETELRVGLATGALDDVRATLGDRWPMSMAPIEADAGLDAWREHAQSWRAGEHLVVVPAWQTTPTWVGNDDLVLVIDPGHTFGSGSHPTTRMCLAELEELVEPDAVVADIGCGSGVLSVAAARLGAQSVHAIDIDEWAATETAANAARNDVSARVHASTDSVASLGAGGHDLVVANIGAATLVALSRELCALVATGGSLVLSGVLDDQADDVDGAFAAHGFAVHRTIADGEWRALVLRAD